MTKNEAINILEERYIHNSTGEDDDFAIAVNTAIDMAIEALHREEAEAKGYCHRINPKNDCNCDERREPLNGKSADIVIIDERREP